MAEKGKLLRHGISLEADSEQPQPEARVPSSIFQIKKNAALISVVFSLFSGRP